MTIPTHTPTFAAYGNVHCDTREGVGMKVSTADTRTVSVAA